MRELTEATGTDARDVGEVVKVRELHTPEVRTVGTTASPAADEHRAAILASLYEERHRLTRAKRLGQATENEQEYLAELNDYIAQWERAEVRVAQQRDNQIWTRLDDLAADLVALKSKAKYEK